MRDRKTVGSPTTFTFATVFAGLFLAMAGCGRSAPWSRPPGPTIQIPADLGDSGYREPPQPRSAVRGPNGVVVQLSGQALPGAIVRLASPRGQHEEVQADASGAWSLTAPPGAAAIYGLSQDSGGRRDQAQGYLAVLPSGSPAAAELRSGAGALSLAAPIRRPAISAIDYDGTGAAVVSGWAVAGQALRVMIDGTMVDEGATGADGRFFLSLPKPLARGAHTVQVLSPGGGAQADVDVSPPPPFAGALHASRRGAGWRLDWTTPTGGVQTTELVALQGPAH
jgi:hypothetical protein